MEIIGALADVSGGELDIVKPLELTKNFATALSEELLAQKVSLKFLVHEKMTIVDPDHVNEEIKCLERDIGNVTASSVTSFEYRLRPKVVLEDEKFLPFQILTRYQLLDGSVYLRTETAQKEVTRERQECELNLDVDVVAQNAIQNASAWAARGDYDMARTTLVANQKMMLRNTTPASPAMGCGAAPASPQRQQQQQQQYGKFLSRAQELDDLLAEEDEAEAPAAEKSYAARKAKRSDKLSSAIYKGKRY